MKNIILYIFLSMVITKVNAQIGISNKIILTGDSTIDRQIDGLSYPYDTTSAVKAEAVMAGMLNHYLVTSVINDTIFLNHYALIPALKKGMKINFLATGLNTGSVYVKIGNYPKVLVKKNITRNLQAGDIKDSMIISIIFDGTFFQLQNPLEKKCPAGFIELNEITCIQPNESIAGVTFFAASIACQTQGARLCTWGEWYYACTNAGMFGISNMTNNFEFIDTSTNSPGQVGTIGNGTCTTTAATTASSSNRFYRCCFTK